MSLQFKDTTEILLYGIFDKDYAQELCNHTDDAFWKIKGIDLG